MIAYYSWSGNTETLANTIQEKTGGDLVRIEPEDSYPDSYDELVERAIHDQRNMENLQIVQNVEHMEDYDIVFIGYPIWFDTAPAVVQVFLDTYDFSGKTVCHSVPTWGAVSTEAWRRYEVIVRVRL